MPSNSQGYSKLYQTSKTDMTVINHDNDKIDNKIYTEMIVENNNYNTQSGNEIACPPRIKT